MLYNDAKAMPDKELSKVRSLLSPSLLSGLVTTFLATAVLTIAIFSYASGSGMVYDYLFGPNSSAELIRGASNSVDAFSNTVFGNPTLNKILFFCFWMIVGLVVYMILYAIFKGTSEAAEDFQETKYMNGRAQELLRTIGTRLAIRSAVLALWVIYWVFFIKILLPFSILCAHIGAGAFPDVSGWGYGGLGLIVLTASIHLHLVFLRLFALKVRLIDNSQSAGF